MRRARWSGGVVDGARGGRVDVRTRGQGFGSRKRVERRAVLGGGTHDGWIL